VHVYESAILQGTSLERTGDRLGSEAHRDLRGEGFDARYASFEWELRSSSAVVRATQEEPGGLVATLDGTPTLMRLTARYPLPRIEQPELQAAPEARLTGSRPSSYGIGGELPTYVSSSLVGSQLAGPLLVDGDSYTWLVTEGWSLTTDLRGDAHLTKEGTVR
jgi:hypothetical protein